MRISSDQKICGIPVLDLRRVFRAANVVVSETWLAHRLKISLPRALKLITALLREGYIKKQSPHTFGYIGWDLTMKGNALGNASAAKPITRKTADRKLEEFLKRIKQVEVDANFLFKVKRAFVFGSFLSDKERIGDIDIAVELAPKEGNRKKFSETYRRKVDKAEVSGRTFKNFVDLYAWPENEVWLALKARSRGLSLHQFDARMTKISKHVLIYGDTCPPTVEKRSFKKAE